MNIKATFAALFLTASLPLFGQELSPNAPKDKPSEITSKEQIAALDRAIAPYVARARATYPAAKARYLAGLPAGHIFFITVRLHDKNGVFEQVFIAVKSIKGDKVTGTIASDLETVKEFRRGQEYIFAESELLDWLVSRPDGTEEGNFVGKFLDTYHP